MYRRKEGCFQGIIERVYRYIALKLVFRMAPTFSIPPEYLETISAASTRLLSPGINNRGTGRSVADSPTGTSSRNDGPDQRDRSTIGLLPGSRAVGSRSLPGGLEGAQPGAPEIFSCKQRMTIDDRPQYSRVGNEMLSVGTLPAGPPAPL